MKLPPNLLQLLALERITRTRLPARLAAAPFRELAESRLARQSLWPDPLMEHHWGALLSGLDEACTVTEVELAVTLEEACFAVEAAWNTALLSSLLCPLREACRYGWEGTGAARRRVDQAADAAFALWGLGRGRC